jgi:hypothetical protein
MESDPEMDSELDPLVRGTDPRNRIRTKMARIPKTVLNLIILPESATRKGGGGGAMLHIWRLIRQSQSRGCRYFNQHVPGQYIKSTGAYISGSLLTGPIQHLGHTREKVVANQLSKVKNNVNLFYFFTPWLHVLGLCLPFLLYCWRKLNK